MYVCMYVYNILNLNAWIGLNFSYELYYIINLAYNGIFILIFFIYIYYYYLAM